MTDLCPFCGSDRVCYPCINGQPGDECKCGECGRSWPFKFIEVYQDSCGTVEGHGRSTRIDVAERGNNTPAPEVVKVPQGDALSLDGRSGYLHEAPPAGISTFVPQGASQGVSDSHLPANSDVVASNNAEGRFKWPADSQVLPPADGTKPSAHREQDADCGIGGEFDLRHRENSPLEESGLSAPVGPGAQCERPGTSSPVAQDVLGDRGEVCHGESLLHAVGSEMGLSRGGSPLEGSVELLTSDASAMRLRPSLAVGSTACCGADAAPGSSADQVPNGGFHPQPGREIGSNREHPGIDNRLQERGIGHSEHMGTTIEELTCAVMRAEERAASK